MSDRLLAGRYELIERIGEGGMATVYKGKDRLLNRYVAVKVLRPEFTKDEQFVSNFRKESQAAAGLSHNNIVSVYDVGQEGDAHFIVMELIEGKTLTEVINSEAPMNYNQVVKIASQVAEALSVAHKNGIIHRDIKPHNILITKDGTVKLADFGIAKAVNDSTLSETANKILGSVHYFSPEQARGSYVDERSDIYSLGIVMYEMLTGKVPFDGDSAVSVALKHINDDMPRPSDVALGIPPALERVILKATDKVQTNRYRDADELLDDLNSIEFVSRNVDPQYKKRAKSDTGEIAALADGKKKKLTTKQKYIIIGCILCAIPLIFLGLHFAGVFDSSDIKAPDLSGMTVEQAKTNATVEKYELKIVEEKQEYSSDFEAGKIISQNPKAGDGIKKGAEIKVVISKGKKQGEIPSLYGKTESGARKALESMGFKLGSVSEDYSDEEKGTVISQDPAAGTKAEEGATVNIVISKGKKEEEKKQVQVPNVVGLSRESAIAQLEAAGLKVGTITEEESDQYEKGVVMWQEYAGTKVDEGTAISIKISKGKAKQ